MTTETEAKTTTCRDIVLQTQPDMKTCVHTCLAMALGVPVERVIERYGGEAMGVDQLCTAFEECGITWNRLVFGTLMHAGWYVLSVPSLNIPRGMHVLIVAYNVDGGMEVFDPACRETYASDGSDLISWSDVIPFWPGGELPNEGTHA